MNDMISVNNSGHVEAVHYDEQAKRLVVRFKSGTYAYPGVPADIGSQIVESAADADTSTGKLINTLVKGGGFEGKRLEQ